jgi:hypothetical protein
MAVVGGYFDALAGEAVAAAAPFRLRFSGRGHFSAPPGPVASGQVDMYLMPFSGSGQLGQCVQAPVTLTTGSSLNNEPGSVHAT